jgi:hypothetical protein
VKNMVSIAFLGQLLSSSLAVAPHVISHKSEWIGDDMKTKIHPVQQRVKILRIDHFSNSQKPLRHFTLHEPIDTYCEGPNAGQWCASALIEQPTDISRAYLSLGI